MTNAVSNRIWLWVGMVAVAAVVAVVAVTTWQKDNSSPVGAPASETGIDSEPVAISEESSVTTSAQSTVETTMVAALDVPEWYPVAVVEALERGLSVSPDECASIERTICSIDAAAQLMEIMRPNASGPITLADAVGRALLYADNAERAFEVAQVGVAELTWSEAAEVGGFSADSDIRLAPDAPVVVVTVAAPISNTEGPEGAELETYDQYTVIYSAASHHGFRVCMGCGDVAVDAMASDYVKGLPDSSFTRDPAEADG